LPEKIKSLLRWAKTTRDEADADAWPTHQVSYMGKVGKSLAWFPFGFHANVPKENLTLVMSMQGNPEARVDLPGSPLSRPVAEPGEVVVYHPATGSKVHFKESGDVDVESVGDVNVDAAVNVNVTAAANVIVTASAKIDLDAPLIRIFGDLVEAGMIGAVKKLVHEVFFDQYDAHTHEYDKVRDLITDPVQTGPTKSSFHGRIDTDTTTKLRGDD
jgi:hypothetical protein